MPGTNQQMAEGKREGEQEEPSPLKKARSQASALLRSETEETLAAWAQATGEDLSSDKYDRIRLAQGEERATGSKAATQAAAAAEHIQEALQLARHSPTWSGSTPLSRSHQPQLSSGWRTASHAQCLRDRRPRHRRARRTSRSHGAGAERASAALREQTLQQLAKNAHDSPPCRCAQPARGGFGASPPTDTVFRARRRLRALLPFLEEEARSATNQALQELDAWATEYWGTEEVVEIVKQTRWGGQN